MEGQLTRLDSISNTNSSAGRINGLPNSLTMKFLGLISAGSTGPEKVAVKRLGPAEMSAPKDGVSETTLGMRVLNAQL